MVLPLQSGLARPALTRPFGRSKLGRHASSSTSAKRVPNTSHTSVTHRPLEKSSLPSFTSTNIVDTYARAPLVLSHGKGSWIYTTTREKYLDFTAGIAVNALGHADAEFARTLGEQAAKLVHTSNVFHNEWAGQLATLLVQLTRKEGGLGLKDGVDAKVFFTSSGTEANEGAFKFARKIAKEKYAGRHPGSSNPYEDCTQTRFTCFQNAFHGRSMGALSATTNAKYQAPFGPLVPGFDVGDLNDHEELRTLITEDTCGVIVEPVQGEGGLAVCEESWLRALRKRCDEVGAVLIFDEVQCGLYRTGKLWAHSALPEDCHPDIVTMAKPLANGYPIGAIMIREQLAKYITLGSHGTTFGGSPLATRMGHHVLTRLSQPSFLSHLRSISSHLHSRLSAFPTFFPSTVQSVRGKGLLTGLGFKHHEDPAKLLGMARERGVLILTAGKDAVRIVPSLNARTEEVDLCADVLESCLVLMEKEDRS